MCGDSLVVEVKAADFFKSGSIPRRVEKANDERESVKRQGCGLVMVGEGVGG